MAVEFKTSMTKAELLEIAAKNGIKADDSMTKAQIVAALEAYNDAEREAEAAALTDDSAPTGNDDGTEGNNTAPAESTAESATEGAGSDGGGAEADNTAPAESAAESATEGAGSDGGGAGADNTAPAESTAESATEGAGSDGGGAGADNTTPAENAAESAQEEPQGYDLFVYAGPSLPRGRLKENAVFNGTREDVKAYLADVLEEYPQIDKLIVPASKLAAFSVKVKTPGNIAHKYYTDIVSAMRGNKEV